MCHSHIHEANAWKEHDIGCIIQTCNFRFVPSHHSLALFASHTQQMRCNMHVTQSFEVYTEQCSFYFTFQHTHTHTHTHTHCTHTHTHTDKQRRLFCTSWEAKNYLIFLFTVFLDLHTHTRVGIVSKLCFHCR